MHLVASHRRTLRHPLCRRLFLYGIMAGALTLAAASAQAQTCTVSMTSVAFGTVNVLPGTPVDTTATVTINCSGGTGNGGQRICVSIGCGAACDSTSRKMPSGSNSARYDLYSDSGRTTLWGSWHTGYDTAGVQLDVGKNSTTNVTVYARFLASQQTDAAAAYTSAFSGDPFISYVNKSGSVPACPTGTLTATGSASVTGTVSSNCTVSATNISFGSQGILSGNKDAQGSLTIQCTSALPYAVSLDGGLSGAIDPTQRKMSLSGANVVYGLYRDSARTQPWGSTSGVNTASGTGTGLTQTMNVYGRVAAQTTPRSGTYTDSVVATITY